MANYINKYANQAAYDADDTKQFPNVSYLIEEDQYVLFNVTPLYATLTLNDDTVIEVKKLETKGLLTRDDVMEALGVVNKSLISKIDITEQVDKVAERCFNWTGYQYVRVNAKEIGDNAFQFVNTTAIKRIEFGTNVQTLGSNIFNSVAVGKNKFISLNPTPATDNMSAFDNKSVYVYVPDDSVEDYKAEWRSISNYSTRILPISKFTGKDF